MTGCGSSPTSRCEKACFSIWHTATTLVLLGPALQSGFGSPGGLDITTFVFTGVLAQTVWQSAALGLISLVGDRESDFSQEIFVSPISRYAIVFGKILGESLVALVTVGLVVARAVNVLG